MFAGIAQLVTFGLIAIGQPPQDLAKVVNSTQVEYGAIETPYGVYVTRQSTPWGTDGRSTIISIQIDKNGDRIEHPASFSLPEYEDSDPYYDAVRDRLCFVSTRPDSEEGSREQAGDIWCTAREGEKWAPPEPLPSPINSEGREYSPVIDRQGRLYFASTRQGGFGQGDIYSATEGTGDKWQVQNSGPAINTPTGEWNVTLSPDGSQLILEASQRAENRSVPGDLYYSQQSENGWAPAIPLSKLNSDSSDLMARWLDDGRLSYASAQKGNGDVDIYIASEGSWEPVNPVLTAVSRSTGDIILLDPIDLTTRKRIKAGTGPHEIATSADGRSAFVPLFGIYPQPHDAPIDSRPPFLQATSKGVAVIDLATGEKDLRTLPNCSRPHGVATDAQATRLWITCETEGALLELKTEDWSLTRRYKLDPGVHKVAFDGKRQRLLTTNPDTGILRKISLRTGEIESIRTGSGAEALTMSRDGRYAWVTNGQDRTLSKVRLETMELEWTADTRGSFPIAVALIEDRDEIWVSNLGSREIAILDTRTGDYKDKLSLPSAALNMAVNVKDGFVYATLPRLNKVIALNIETRKVSNETDGIMEGDDLDLIPSTFFAAPSDS